MYGPHNPRATSPDRFGRLPDDENKPPVDDDLDEEEEENEEDRND